MDAHRAGPDRRPLPPDLLDDVTLAQAVAHAVYCDDPWAAITVSELKSCSAPSAEQVDGHSSKQQVFLLADTLTPDQVRRLEDEEHEQLVAVAAAGGLPTAPSTGDSDCEQLCERPLLVAFRGTATLSDWLTDRRAKPLFSDALPGRVHDGFSERAATFPVHFLRRQLERGRRIIVTGHSLGGAVATVVALRLLHEMTPSVAPRVRCITFGAPLIGDSDLRETVKKRNWASVFHHFIHPSDVVPRLLAWSPGQHSKTVQGLLVCARCAVGGRAVLSSPLLLSDHAAGFQFARPFASQKDVSRALKFGSQKGLAVPAKVNRETLDRIALPKQTPLYHPFGRFYVLSDEDVWHVDDLNAQNSPFCPDQVRTQAASLVLSSGTRLSRPRVCGCA